MQTDWFQKEVHKMYIDFSLKKQMPSGYLNIDTQKMMFLFFLTYSAKCLNLPIDESAIYEFIEINAVRNENNKIVGFKESPALIKNEPHLVHSYCAVAVLKLLKTEKSEKLLAELMANKEDILLYVKSLQNPDKSLKGSLYTMENDLRMIFSCCAYLDLLFLLNKDGEFERDCREFIYSCQNPNGGFGLQPLHETHGGATYCGIASLMMLGGLDKLPLKTNLIQWLLMRQIDTSDDENIIGGFQGRINKPLDSCYAFWIGWTLAILGYKDLVEFDYLKPFIKQCQFIKGGFSRQPFSKSDPIHTLHAMYGLMLETEDNQCFDFCHGIQKF